MDRSRLIEKPNDFPQHKVSRYYSVYGLRVRTPIPLSIPELPDESGCDIDVLPGDSGVFEGLIRDVHLNSDWAQAHPLPGRWLYARLEGMFDFLISPDGSQIVYRPLSELSAASFETYLLGLLMKAVLIKKDIYSVHASAVVIDDQAVAFMGANGFGKSTLAASFVDAGYPLLTDDVLRLDTDEGRIWGYPGPAQLKLLPESRKCLDAFSGGVPMDPEADKWLFAVSGDLQCNRRVRLAAIYCVSGPEGAREAGRVSVEALGPSEALTELLYGTHIDRVVERDRVTNPFGPAKHIAKTVPVRRLVYPWALTLLPSVRDAVLADAQGLR